MNTKEIVDSIMERSDAPCFTEVCNRLGVNTNTFANQMKRGARTVKLFSRVLQALGYRIVVVPEKTVTDAEWFDVD